MHKLFLINDSTEQYKTLVETAKLQNICNLGFYEKHHIIPKSLGGSNDLINLVLLTPIEHLKAHELLTQMTFGTFKAKMSYAYWMMINVSNDNQERIKLLPEEFEKVKKLRADLKTLDETKNKIGQSRKNKIAVYNSDINIFKFIGQADLPHYEILGYSRGERPKSENHKKAISNTNKIKGILPKSLGWNKGLTKFTSPSVAKGTAHMIGKPAWNKGKPGTGFGDPKINPMNNPESIKKMLESRKRNKEKNANKKI